MSSKPNMAMAMSAVLHPRGFRWPLLTGPVELSCSFGPNMVGLAHEFLASPVLMQ